MHSIVSQKFSGLVADKLRIINMSLVIIRHRLGTTTERTNPLWVLPTLLAPSMPRLCPQTKASFFSGKEKFSLLSTRSITKTILNKGRCVWN